ncbi:hypothetical protein [Delftia sp. PE138]|uniref:hypothetical protein n=1 Tax=Delftia sp. PE138 TaxID=1812483 RepID=UPI001BAF8EC0|nr:hypothetical protein [Delftia sp. PE138]MBS3721215.1 hypothetical protein [Delftia sp. PE138]
MQDMLVHWLVTGLGMAAWGVPFIWLLFYISRGYLTNYANKKGENLATKEDVREITKEIEAAKEEFSHRLEDLKAHHQLRMVAAERRLQAHQEAFLVWSKLMAAAQTDPSSILARVQDCQSWYASNCIFLSNKSRSAFNHAIVSAIVHHSIRAPMKGSEEAFLTNWNRIESAGNVFLAEVELPSMTKNERDVLANPPSALSPA